MNSAKTAYLYAKCITKIVQIDWSASKNLYFDSELDDKENKAGIIHRQSSVKKAFGNFTPNCFSQ